MPPRDAAAVRGHVGQRASTARRTRTLRVGLTVARPPALPLGVGIVIVTPSGKRRGWGQSRLPWPKYQHLHVLNRKKILISEKAVPNLDF